MAEYKLKERAPRPAYFFADVSIYFKVDKIIYKLHPVLLALGSKMLADMFSIPFHLQMEELKASLWIMPSHSSILSQVKKKSMEDFSLQELDNLLEIASFFQWEDAKDFALQALSSRIVPDSCNYSSYGVSLENISPDTTMKAVVLSMIPSGDTATGLIMISSVVVSMIADNKVEYNIQPSKVITVGKVKDGTSLPVTSTSIDLMQRCHWWCAVLLGHLGKEIAGVPAVFCMEFETQFEALFKTVPSSRITMPI
ncbi:hypothetical protein M422DRAFT_55198 [Sphaerobolus stellatus SS14]|uniref:Unplaced genomic scaffold SPHSTscaffold_271, whole genome shotgun sequence n=1 Tax=Sphaerobolus stellatus (strain SS14) TaxID=990650 RepID=A0A0C9UNP7_SPHS4|nr:hypothetical protein M422DRAFT_55198 [Sphaerobolus stellatus SS14]